MNKSIQEKSYFIKDVFKVIENLLEHPDKRSKDISKDLKITKDQLVEIYHFIAIHKDFRDLLYTVPTFEMIRNNRKIEAIIKGQEIYPEIVEIHLGEECNLNCVMCFSRDSTYNNVNSPMDIKMVKNLFSELQKNGVKEVWFSGGKEPLMSPIALDSIELANKMGFITRLYTNGELLDSRSKYKKIIGSYQVRFSLNATDSETYDRIHFASNGQNSQPTHRRVGTHVFEKVIKNISDFISFKKKTKAKTIVAISFILQPINYKEILEFIRLAFSLGADSAQIRTDSASRVRMFTQKEKREILNQIEEIKKKKNSDSFKMAIDMRGVTLEELNSDKEKNQFLPGIKKAHICLAGAFKRGINPYGEVFNCEFSMHPGNIKKRIYSTKKIGDLKKNSFSKIIKNSKGKYPKTCPQCQAFEYCLNISLEKLRDDYQWGIKINDQPFYEGAKNG